MTKLEPVSIARRLFELRRQRNQIEDEERGLRAELSLLLNLGRHDGATLYRVRATRVKAYNRRGYRAVRVRKV